MRSACWMIVALVVAGGLAVAGDYTEPFAIAETRIAPEYPPAAQAAGFQGSVAVAAVINTDGTVGAVEVVDSSTARLGFEEAAVAAIKGWRFEPAREDGEAVDAVYAYRFYFESPGEGSRIPAYVSGQYLTSFRFGGVMSKSPAMQNRGGGLGLASEVRNELVKVKLPPGRLGAMYNRDELIPRPEGGRNIPVAPSPMRR